jgi:hypothetical protein
MAQVVQHLPSERKPEFKPQYCKKAAKISQIKTSYTK